MNKKLGKIILLIAIILILVVMGYCIVKHFITFNVKNLSKDEESIIDYANIEEKVLNYEDTNEDEAIKKYVDSNGDIVYIPKGFKVSDKDDEQTIETGLVVIRNRWK